MIDWLHLKSKVSSAAFLYEYGSERLISDHAKQY